MVNYNVRFTYDGVNYELGFNRRTAKMLQDLGFKRDELVDKSFTMVPMLFHTSFAMNHKGTKVQTMDEIYEKIPESKRDKVLANLLKSYLQTQTTLFGGGDESDDEENGDFIHVDID